MNICGQSGKTIFHTMGEAHKAVAALRNKHARLRLHVYRCSNCGGFHTTKRDRAELMRLVTKEAR